jgi:Flp pilus assembly protein TadD
MFRLSDCLHWLPLSLVAAAMFVATAFSLFVTACGGGEESPPAAEFVGRQACASCHQDQMQEWEGSHHDLAMDPATDSTVLGNFDNATFMKGSITSRFFKRDSAFYVHTQGPDGEMRDYEVKYTFGVTPLQQYLVEFPGGRLQALNIAWDAEREEWYHLYPDEELPPDDELHWTNRLHTWNTMCASCHSTDLQKNYDLDADSFHTTWSEIDVSCEGCHGPGSEHVEWARRSETSGYEGSDETDVGLSVDLSSTDSDAQIEACARCHSRRSRITMNFEHGEPFLDHFTPELLRETLYYPDGQIQDEVYVYGSFIQSRMYREGIRCSDCHNPHTLELQREGNDLCLKCHAGETYDTSAHHFHPEASAGARCVECHMPGKEYMGIDFRRDHSIRIPRPDLSETLGTPNACTRCHTDRPNQWAAEAMDRWYGDSIRSSDPHYGEVFAAAREGYSGAEQQLVELSRDTLTSKMVRATALHLMRDYTGDDSRQAIERALRSEEPLVRYAAVRSTERMSPRERASLVKPLLEDPIRAVRIEAARVLAAAPDWALEGEAREVFEAARREYEQAMEAIADRPEAHMNLAIMYEDLGQLDSARQAYRTAIRLDSTYVPAKLNLARQHNEQGNNQRAEQLLREVVRDQPDMGDAHYMLGLLLAEGAGNLEGVVEHLARAAELMPERPRVQYNYGLALQRSGQREAAEQALQRALELQPETPDFLNALAIFYAQQGDWETAHEYAQRLVQLQPDAAGPQRLLNQIRSQLEFQ